jgi:hypothetical protein
MPSVVQSLSNGTTCKGMPFASSSEVCVSRRSCKLMGLAPARFARSLTAAA